VRGDLGTGRLSLRFRVGAFAVSVIVSCTASDPPSGPGAAPRPNILIVITDDQRADSLRTMPAIRRWFGRGGTTYRNAFATTPLCCPARASIMTGRYVHNHGVLTNHHTARLDHDTTLQRHLRGAAYLTAIAGKFLNGWDIRQPPPHFDRYAIDSPFSTGNGFVRELFNVDGDLRRVAYATTFLERTAVRFLRSFERRDGRPWLLYVTPFAPHEPAIPEARYRRTPVPRWRPGPAVPERDVNDKPPFLPRIESLPLDALERFRARQLRSLRSVDDLIDRLMGELDDLGEGNTLAVFTSDNGLTYGEHGPFAKRLPYDPSIRVPLLVRWPGRVPAGKTDERLAANVDLVPTVLAAVGVRVPGTVDGRPLWEEPPRRRIFLEHFYDGEPVDIPAWASVRTLAGQYVEWYRGDRRIFAEYYDLRADPAQLRNLLADGDRANDPRLGPLRRSLRHLRICRGAAGPQACS
jgi:arylsulfatase A-like enzyme